MKWLLNALSTSVGRKFVMAITGLLLCGFLAVHLGGNLLLYAGADSFNGYAHALHERAWLVLIAEAGLLALFVVHIYLAVRTSRDNREARRVGYERKESKVEGRTMLAAFSPESWMFVSGAIVLGFLILHLSDFRFSVRTDIDYAAHGDNEYRKVLTVLKTPVSAAVYVIGSLVLGLHLGHGFASAFRSLGISHPKYDRLIKWIGVAFSWIVGLGFASFPLWAWAMPVPS